MNYTILNQSYCQHAEFIIHKAQMLDVRGTSQSKVMSQFMISLRLQG